MKLWIVAALVALVAWYAMVGRRWLLTQPWAALFFRLIEPIETKLFRKSETLLVSRLLGFGGFLVTLYDTFAVLVTSLDWTPVTSRLLASVPPDLRGLVVSGAIGLLGLLIGWLRKRTTKPIEIVALPIDAPPEVQAAAAQVEDANQQAVAVVIEAKKAGEV